MKPVPAWIKRELRPDADERTQPFQPIDENLLAWSTRHTEPDSLRLRSIIRQLQDLPEAEPWARKPNELVHGGEQSLFPNAPPGDEAESSSGDETAAVGETVEEDELDVAENASSPEGELTERLPHLDEDGTPSDAPILSTNPDDVPRPEPEEGLEGGDVILLSEAAQALLDAENERSEELDETLSELEEESFEPLPPDPTKGERRGPKALILGRLPLSAFDEPVPTPRWLLLLLLLFLGLAGGRTEQAQRALGDLNRQELAWSLNGQVGSGRGITLGPGIIVTGPAQVSRVSIGAQDSTIQLSTGRIEARIDDLSNRSLVVQAGPTVVSANNGRVEVVRDGQRVEIWVEDGQVRVQTATNHYLLGEGEQLVVEGERVYGSSQRSGANTGDTAGGASEAGSGSTPRTTGNQSGASGSPESRGTTSPSGASSGSSSGSTADNPGPTPGESGTSTGPRSSGESAQNGGMGANGPTAPTLPEIAASPFDDVLQALDAFDSQVCNDDLVAD